MERWSFLHATYGARYGIKTANLVESYNFVLRGNMDFPITTIVEGIFLSMVNSFKDRRQMVEMHILNNPTTRYCSKFMNCMDDKMEKGRHLTVVTIGEIKKYGSNVLTY
jgi:hypothetical protein